ncbi:putative membrane protein [Priestia megaterium]|nr:putative membrane protein [Priestia megaterium]
MGKMTEKKKKQCNVIYNGYKGVILFLILLST